MTPSATRIEEVRREFISAAATWTGLQSSDDARKQSAYLSSSLWRYAVTLDLLRHANRPLRQAAVVDIGSYPGHLAAILSVSDLAKVRAITLMTSPAFESRMLAVGVEVVACDVERDALPFADRSMEFVLCCELIEHLEGDVAHMLREARRILRDDGMFLLTTPNHASMKNRWALLRGRSVYPDLADPDYPFYAGAGVRNPMRHTREFTASEIRLLMGEAGYRDIRAMTLSPPLRKTEGLSVLGLISTRVLWALGNLTRGGGELIVATARP